MDGGDIALWIGIAVPTLTAAAALYRARPQRQLDESQKHYIDQQVVTLQASHDRRRTLRLLRLEQYLDRTIDHNMAVATYNREVRDCFNHLMDLLIEAIDAGFLPGHSAADLPKLHDPPEPPELPEMPDEDH